MPFLLWLTHLFGDEFEIGSSVLIMKGWPGENNNREGGLCEYFALCVFRRLNFQGRTSVRDQRERKGAD